MNGIPYNTQLKLVGTGYVAAVVIAAVLVFMRHLAYVHNASDVVASGGMWAGGDLMLELMIVGMFLVVTLFLALVIAKSESAYTIYSKALVGISLTAPLSVALISIPAIGRSEANIALEILGFACLFRVFASPLLLVGIGASRLFARFPRPKRLTVYALAIEGLTLVGLAAFLFSGHGE